MSASKARSEFAETLDAVKHLKKRIVLQRRGKDVAVLVPVEDAELLGELEDRIDLEAARKALREPGRISWRKVKASLGL